jgi:phosphate transport system permease protein
VGISGDSLLSIRTFGFGFITSRSWNPIKGEFGALPFIYGTVMSSLIALCISVPLSLGIAVFLVEQAPRLVARPLAFWWSCSRRFLPLCMASGESSYSPRYKAVPRSSVRALVRLDAFFRGPVTGIGLITGGLILAIMVTPIISAVVRDVLAAVPGSQREAALALGATKWEMIRVVLVNGAPGIAGAVILGLGRALGETMAVTMVIGNRPEISLSFFDPS